MADILPDSIENFILLQILSLYYSYTCGVLFVEGTCSTGLMALKYCHYDTLSYNPLVVIATWIWCSNSWLLHCFKFLI